MKENPWITDYAIVKFTKDLSEFQDYFQIVLPSKKRNDKVHRVENDTPIAKSHYKGKFDGFGDGNVIELMDDGFGVFGYAMMGDSYYTIEALDQKRSVIYKHDSSKLPAASCGAEPGQGPRIDPDLGTHRTGPNTANCRVNVLVLYTQQAQNWAGGVPAISSIGMTGLSQTNTAFINTNINGRVTGGQLVFLNQSLLNLALIQDPSTNAATLSNEPYIQSLRASYKADIVVVLHDFTFNNGQGEVVGSVANFANPNFPVAVIKASFATTAGNTFTHEVGHLFNARHLDDNNALPGRGHQFATTGNTRGTILATTLPFNQRALQFSNPDVLFNGQPTGLANRDNSFNINTNFCPMANWVNSYDVVLNGPSSGSPGYYTYVTAFVHVNQYPCTLKWYADPIPYASNLVKTETITNVSSGGGYGFTFPSIPPNSYFYITAQLIPQSPFSPINKTLSIFNSSSYKIILESTQSNDEPFMMLFPNPSNYGDEITIKTSSFGPKDGELIIFSLEGEYVCNVKFDNRVAKIDGTLLPKGNYTIVEKDTKTVVKLIKQ